MNKNNLQILEQLMIQTYQTEGLNMLEHGKQVWYYYQKLLNNDIKDMKIPFWQIEYQDRIFNHLHSIEDIELYTTYHDCGKTRVLQIDEFGKRHFPNHASESEKMWLEFGGSNLIAELMGLDMIFHTETPEQILGRGLDIKTICTLLLAALAELHANASMFGGITSQSFCIKYKKLDKRAKRILNHYFKEENNATI